MMKQARFTPILEFVLGIEGDYVNDLNDRGGETRYGISKRAYPDLDIQNLTLDTANTIYKNDYWYPSGANKLPEVLAWALFDAAIHHGVRDAVMMLQRCLRVTADGIVGQQTIAAANAYDAETMLIIYLAHRGRSYQRIISNTPSQSAFALGWFTRLFKLQHFILYRSSL